MFTFSAKKRFCTRGTCLDYPGLVIAFAVEVTEKKRVGGEKTALVNAVVQMSSMSYLEILRINGDIKW